MRYVIINTVTDNGHKASALVGINTYTEKGAKIVSTRLTNKTGQKHVPMKLEDYQKRPIKMKTVHNLMSGKEITIAEDTPLCCDPSSETYWSM